MNFNDILETKVEDIQRPPLPPFGNYKFVVFKVPTIREQKANDGSKTWDVVEFPLRAVEAGPDVDMEQLRDFGDPKNIIQQKVFMFERGDENAMLTTLNSLKRFVTEHLNVDWPEGTAVKGILPRTVNAFCMGELNYQPDKKDPEIMYARLKSTTTAQ